MKFGKWVADGMWDECSESFLKIKTVIVLKVLQRTKFGFM